MFDFLKPSIGLPINFLRTAFQTGTALYRNDRTPADKFGALSMAQQAISEIHPFLSGALQSLTDTTQFTTGYFQNELGGTIIYAHFDRPSFFNLQRQASLIVIGEQTDPIDPQEEDFYFQTCFSFIGIQTREGLVPDKMALLQDYTGGDIYSPVYEDVRVKHETLLADGFCFADLCFRDVLGKQPVKALEHHSRVKAYSGDELVSHFNQLKERGFATLEDSVQISRNVPLNTYVTGPVI